MWMHLVNLLGHSWQTFRSSLGTTTLGFIAPLLVSLISILVTLYLIFREHGIAAMLKHWKEDALIAIRVVVIVTFLVYGPIFFYEGILRTIFDDHEALVLKNQKLLDSNRQMRTDLEWRKHNLSTGDAVFPNIIYMLQSFEKFKIDMAGQPCVMYATAPQNTLPLASEMMQLGGPLSGCSPLGPMGQDADTDPEAFEHMSPNAITVHALEDEKAANGLFSTLGNQIQLKRSYKMFRHPEKRWAPQRPGEHVVWLQFGNNVKWNSELMYASQAK